MLQSDLSLIVVKDGKILTKKKGLGIKPFLEAIEELKERMYGSTVADRILGKASALLCVYAKISNVYSPQSTKTALAVLIRAGIPGHTDMLIEHIKNKTGDDICPFEKMLLDIDSPEVAYNILKNAIKI